MELQSAPEGSQHESSSIKNLSSLCLLPNGKVWNPNGPIHLPSHSVRFLVTVKKSVKLIGGRSPGEGSAPQTVAHHKPCAVWRSRAEEGTHASVCFFCLSFFLFFLSLSLSLLECKIITLLAH